MSNREHLDRVSNKIGAAIVRFCRARIGQTFHADELRRYVVDAVGEAAPGSADRILRDFRQRGLIDYEVLDRRASLYLVRAVNVQGTLYPVHALNIQERLF